MPSAIQSLVATLELGQPLEVQGDCVLGLDISVASPTWLYAFSVFGPGPESQTRRLRPVVPAPLETLKPERVVGPIVLAPGDYQLGCTSLSNPEPYEGLLVLTCSREEPELTRLQEAMLQMERNQKAPLGLPDVAALDAELRARARGESLGTLSDEERTSLLGEALTTPTGTADGLWRRRGWASWDFLFAVQSKGH